MSGTNEIVWVMTRANSSGEGIVNFVGRSKEAVWDAMIDEIKGLDWEYATLDYNNTQREVRSFLDAVTVDPGTAHKADLVRRFWCSTGDYQLDLNDIPLLG